MLDIALGCDLYELCVSVSHHEDLFGGTRGLSERKGRDEKEVISSRARRRRRRRRREVSRVCMRTVRLDIGEI